METTIHHRFLQDKAWTVLIIALVFWHLTGCGAPSTEQGSSGGTGTVALPPTVPVLNETPGPLPSNSTPTQTPSPAPTRTASTATLIPTKTPTAGIPTSTWRSGWVDFINGYYGYAISVPPSASVSKNDGVDGYDPNELPADWNEKESYFDYLNKMYPPGLCVTIEYGTKFIQIKVADWLGGKYKDCAYVGGIGEETNFVWDWIEEDVVIGDKSYTATILRQCENHEPGAKCGEPLHYGIPMDDGARISLGGITWNPQTSYDQPLDNLAVMFEILRTYREAPRNELYCPQPAPTRLSAGGFAYVSTDPPLIYSNVRSAPGINQSLIGSIPPGRAFELLEGPICNNSLQWWRVRVRATNLVGWTAEGDHRSFWLTPCNSRENCGE